MKRATSLLAVVCTLSLGFIVACGELPGGADAGTSDSDAAVADSGGGGTDAAGGTDTNSSGTDSSTPSDSATGPVPCSTALSCTLGCEPTDDTCIDACADELCDSSVVLWEALFTCINDNCYERCLAGLSDSDCRACREEFCQDAFTACGAATCG